MNRVVVKSSLEVVKSTFRPAISVVERLLKDIFSRPIYALLGTVRQSREVARHPKSTRSEAHMSFPALRHFFYTSFVGADP